MIHTMRSAAVACALLGLWGAAVAMGMAYTPKNTTTRDDDPGSPFPFPDHPFT